MPTLVRKIVRRTLIAKGIGVALVALLIGGTHLLLRQLPAHKAELTAWVSSELGLSLEFAGLDAGWSWRGPELAFHDASVMSGGDTTPFLKAREASVGFNPLRLFWQLVTGSRVGVDRLTFEGTELTLVRAESGTFRLLGAPATAQDVTARVQVPPDVDVLVRDSVVRYLDASRGITWNFNGVAGSMRRDANVLVLEARADPPTAVAGHIDVSMQATVTQNGLSPGAQFTGDWRLSANVSGLDLSAAADLLPASAFVPRSGHGDLATRLEWQTGQLVGGNVEVELSDVSLSASGRPGTAFQRIGFKGDWERSDDAWRAAFRDLSVRRGDREWPEGTLADVEFRQAEEGLSNLMVRSSFLRLEDLTPFLATLPAADWQDAWFALAPRGDLRDFDFTFDRDDESRMDYSVSGRFTGLGVRPYAGRPGLTELSGEVRADSRTGRLELASTGATFAWPGVFRQPIGVPELRGVVVWRAGQDAIRIVSDDLVLATNDATSRSNLEIALPMDGSSPVLDLRTQISEFAITAAPRYLPVHKLPPAVVEWLDNALQGGRVRETEVVFAGPLRAFPFDGGEGEFQATLAVEGGQLAFVTDWPVAADLNGTVEFRNAGFRAAGTGAVLGNRASDVHVAIPDLRLGELSMQATTAGPLDQVLAFLNSAPMISRYLGADFARLESPAGQGDVSFHLDLPLRALDSYRLTADLEVVDAELAFRGLSPRATELSGSLTLADGMLRGHDIRGIFLDGPVVISVDAENAPGYRARVDVEGEVTIDAVVAAFNLPYGDLLAGQTDWHGSLMIPSVAGAASLPAKITVDSNLSGVALRFPAPFAKPPGEPSNLQVELSFPEGGLEMRGYVGATRRFAVDLDAPSVEGDKFLFRRAALRFGGALPDFRADRGVTVDGSLPALPVDDWLGLFRASAGARSDWSGELAGADLDIANFSVFGQQLGSTKLIARRRTDDWQFEIDSDAIAGTVLVPMDLNRDPKVVAVMRRLYLSAGDEPSDRHLDPRELPGVQLHADAFGIGQRQLGRTDAEILSDPLGLRLVSFETATESFTAQGSGSWFVGPSGDTTRFAVTVNSTDVGRMLEQLGLAAFVEAKGAEVTANVYWPGGPSGSWLDHLNGDLALRTETGSLIEVEPGGAGRVMGLLSISALPRRLSLDFRDVFKRGLVFDEITADFVIVDGNAYTDNLKLTGPVAEVGVIGRTGLRDHDYRQQAVITAEPGKMLPTVGALIGGPTVAAALLIFTRIFKKPLGGIGRASYCVTGSWQEPTVERLTPEQLEQGSLCAEMPPNGALRRPDEVASR